MDQDKASKLLKQKVDALERENSMLKKSLFELSARYNSLAHKLGPFQLHDILDTAMDVPISPTLQQKEQSEMPEKDGKLFSFKNEFLGHSGAVYCVEFSPCAKYIASGSFDKTCRIWDFSNQKELQCFNKHNLNVSDISWSMDSTELLSGSYDQTCKTWNIEKGALAHSYQTEGYVQCVAYNKQECFKDGRLFVTGDSMGNLKIWDLRLGKVLYSFAVEPTKSISHVLICDTGADSDIPNRIAVNSYDNVIRIYDSIQQPQNSLYKLNRAFKGFKNKNYPIKSSYFHNTEGSQIPRPSHSEELFKEQTENILTEKKMDGPLIATGSAEPYAYIYSLMGENSQPLQRLEGHTNRVYGVQFHPREPTLVTCSADFTIKTWTSLKKRGLK